MKEKKCRIEKVFASNGEKPTLLQFQHGGLLNDYIPKENCGIFEDKNSKNVAGLELDKLIYSSEVQSDDIYKTFVAIRNRKTHTVKLVAVDVATLKPIIQRKRKILEDDPELITKSTRMDLSKQFGSKRAKRQTEQLEKLKQDVGNIKEQLETTAAAITVKEEDLEKPSMEENTAFRPPIDRNALSIEEVYKLDKLVPLDLLDSLDDEAKTILAEEEITSVAPFVKLALINLRDSSSKTKMLRCKLWLYINYLSKMLTSNAKEISKHKFNPCETSPAVGNHILNNFTEMTNHGRMRPNSMRDKTICYILVLSMIASEYTLNVEQLARDVKQGVKKLQDLGRILAFSSTPSTPHIMTLKYPLPPPITGRSGPRKRRT